MKHTIDLVLCKDLCIRILSYLIGLFGYQLLSPGCRAIPAGHFNFDPAMAKYFGGKDGVTKAIIYQRFMGWIESNATRGHNIRDGQAWSYNTYKQWAAEIPFLHYKTIEKHVGDLEALGLLTSQQFDLAQGNGRKYYSSPLRLADRPEQMLLPLEDLTPMGGVECSALNNTESPKQKPSKPKIKTPTPARAVRLFGGVGVFPANVPGSEMPEKQNEIPEQRPGRLDGSDLEDMDSAGSRATRAQNAPTPVPPPPFPDDTTEGIEDTEPIEVPSYAQIFAIPDAEVRGWIEKEPARLESWCAYAADQDNLYSPGGFVRTGMRIKGHMPPSCSSTPKSYSQSWMLNGLADEPDNYLEWIVSDDCNFGELHKAEARAILAERAGNPIRRDNTDGRAYITNEFADFIEH